MSEKNWGDTVVGWFIVKDEDEAQKAQSGNRFDRR